MTFKSVRSHTLFARAIFATLLTAPLCLAAQTTPTPTGWATIRGVAYDSVHQTPLVNAVVMIEGQPRIGLTDAYGEFKIDSIPPGSYRLTLAHAVIDTLGILITTAPLPMRPGEVVSVEMAIPSAARLIAMRCPPAMLARFGPGAIMGQVSDPDSARAAVGSKVQLLYEDPPILGMKPRATVREGTVDSTGNYRICGLPTPLTGKLQVFRNGVTSGQVEVKLEDGPLALRSLSIAAAQQVVTTPADSSGKTIRTVIGAARLRGKILNREGRPVEAARVSIEGSSAAALTNQRGEFTLDSLPSGTQSVEVRKLGYGPTERAVELSSQSAANVTVIMNPYELPAVRIEANRESALQNLGYTERKNRGFGYFLDGDNLRTEAGRFSDVMRGATALKFTPTSNGKYAIQSARDPNGGCVDFIVDNQHWKEMVPGDIDDFVAPSEMRAVEVYNPATAPAQFQTPGSSGCVTVVVWTVRSLNRARKK